MSCFQVRNIVDKTAGFVARNGAEFEHRIKQNEVNNPKFNFLNPGDPYHAYYQHKVVQIRWVSPFNFFVHLDSLKCMLFKILLDTN